MKRSRVIRILLFSFLFTTLFVSCDLFNQLFCDDETDTPTGSVIDSLEIGSAGGVLKSDSIEVTIPSGAIAANQLLKLVKVSDAVSNFSNPVSAQYRIDGFIENPEKPISFQILPTTPLAENQSGVFVVETNSLDEKLFSSQSPQEAKDSSGWLVAQVKLYNPDLDPNKSTTTKSITASNSYIWYATTKSKHTTTNFSIYYDTPVATTNMVKLGEYLEDAVDKFKALGFSFSISGAEVYVWQLYKNDGSADTDTYGKVHLGAAGRKIQINQTIATDLNMLRATAGHEVFHWVQYEYDGSYFSWLKNIWVAEAFSTWSETMFTSSPTYYPDVIDGNEYEPFQGAQKGASMLAVDAGDQLSEVKQNHGYGMGSFVQFLVRKYGTGLPLKIYQELKNGTKPVYAFHRQTSYHLASDWQFYLEDLMMDKLFTKPGVPFHRNFAANNSPNISDHLVISTSDTSVTYTHDYADLSARMFRVDASVSFAGFDPKMRLKFKLDKTSNMEAISIYKTAGSAIEFLGSTFDSIEIGGLDEINKQYHQLYAMVSNSNFTETPAYYTNTAPIELTIETVGVPSGCQGSLIFDGIMRLTDSDGVRYDTVSPFIEVIPFIELMTETETRIGVAEGELNGRKFISEYDQVVPLSDGNFNHHVGKIEVSFNEAKDAIEEFKWTSATQWHYYGKIVQYRTNITCVDIPFYSKDGNKTTFAVIGSLKDHMSAFTYHETYADGSTRDLQKVIPGNGNTLGVSFIGLDGL